MSIYKISKTGLSDCYVGSSSNFTHRMAVHRSLCNGSKDNRRLYNFIRENGGWDTWNKEILIDGISSKRERFLLEAEYSVEHGSNLNTYKANACFKDTDAGRYYQANREIILTNKKTYYLNKKFARTQSKDGSIGCVIVLDGSDL